MRDCKKIEPLLYLHRDGELTPGEESLVREHLDGCPRCAGVLRALRSLDDALSVVRAAPDAARQDRSVVDRTMEAMRGASLTGGRPAMRPSFSGPAFGVIRPAFGFLLLSATLLLSYQQGRDTYRVMMMEERLAARTSADSQERISMAGRVSLLIEAFTPAPGRSSVGAPSAASVLPGSLIPRIGREFEAAGGEGSELFRIFAEKYPALSKVNPYDGIDEAEREILTTEGKDFLTEFRQLTLEGDTK